MCERRLHEMVCVYMTDVRNFFARLGWLSIILRSVHALQFREIAAYCVVAQRDTYLLVFIVGELFFRSKMPPTLFYLARRRRRSKPDGKTSRKGSESGSYRIFLKSLCNGVMPSSSGASISVTPVSQRMSTN